MTWSQTRAGLLAVVAAAAAMPASAARPIRFDRLSLEEGLSQSTVQDILQDRQGYVWLATEDGLNRHDGHAFKVYRHEPGDAGSLPSSFVWDVEEDQGGNLWVATSAGLARLDRATDRVTRITALPARNARALRFSSDGAILWVGTRDAGVFRFEVQGGQWRRFAHADGDATSLADDRVYALLVDRRGRLWVGTDGGLDRLGEDGTSFTHVPWPGGAASPGEWKVRALIEDQDGAIWVGTSANGVGRLDPATGAWRRFRADPGQPGSLAHDQVRALLQDDEGRLWVGTGDGLDLFDPVRETFSHYRHDPRQPRGLGDGHVLALAQDRGGVLWVGTRLGGAHKWNPLSWQFGHVAPQPEEAGGLGSGYVTSFSEDRAGRLWIGTFDAGVYAMDRTTGRMAAHRHVPGRADSLPSDRVMALRHDHRGHLWIGTQDAGLVRFDAASGAFKQFRSDPRRPDGLSTDGVTALLEGQDGLMWLGTYGGGLERFDPQTERFAHFRHDADDPSTLSGDRISSLAEAADGRLWVGTMEAGLNLLDPRSGRAERFAHRADDPASLPSDTVHTLFVDAAGQLWIGTHSGLSRMLAGGGFETFTTRAGLPSDVVYGVRADAQGRLWLSTNNGLSRFDPRTREFVNYAVSHGLQAAEFNYGAWYQSPSGELAFGGVAGFNLFRPDRLKQVTQPPAVVLTALTVGHRPVGGPPDVVRELSLGFRDKVLGIEFAALDFTAPDRNRFAYKLDGFDPDWVPLAGRRSVTYTNLSPGRYTFRLRGANADGRWNEEGLALPVAVAAAPWATPWAWSAYAAVLLGGVIGMARLQKRKLDKEAEYARVLEFRVQERTQELSQRQQELERVNEELAQASITDALTGLANRRFLTEYLEKEVALLHRRYNRLSEGPFSPEMLDLAFMMIDLDHFKTINDTAGHAAGDAVLRQVKDLLKAASRSSDIIVRWGGDEFLLVARDLSGERLAELAERIRTQVGKAVFEIGEGRVVRTTCSVGFACYPFFREQLDALSWEQVISVADRALYVAKASGRNSWVGFHPGLAALPIQGLFGSISNNTTQLVREGTLRVTSSVEDTKALVWDLPSSAAANG
jgi:diguanylate cyclase (GGDEF)-like protein